MPPTRRLRPKFSIATAKAPRPSMRANTRSRRHAARSGRTRSCRRDEWLYEGGLVSRLVSVSKSANQEGGLLMRTTRRRFVQGTLATTALSGIPGIARAEPARNRTIRAVMQGDLRSLDPIWTTANITAYHGAMIYDTLFAPDANQRAQ